MRLDLQTAAAWMNAEGAVSGTSAGWSVDSRTLEPGDVYFALRGPVHDGHDYIPQAFERGAACCVADRDVPGAGMMLRAANTLAALQLLARQARRHWSGDVVGVTGSAGKTTVKDVIAHFLAVRYPVGKTIGNLNNHVGVPLSILRLPDEAKVAVLEMGMNHAGEIRELAGIAQPRVGVITNVGYAHIEFFDSIGGIARAKRELIEALPSSGIAILNADDEQVARFAESHPGKSITYGFHDQAEVRATAVSGNQFTCDGVTFITPLAGRHGVLNVLAGIAAARAFGIPAAGLTEAARTIPTGKMRGERIERNGYTILNDAYNANPEAMRSMLDVLAAMPARRHVAVLGEMLELGAQSEPLHRELGAYAAAKKIDVLLGVRGAARAMLDAAIHAGMPAAAIHFFPDAAQAGEALKTLLQPGDAVLFKGSRGVRVEVAMDKLLEASA